MIFIYIMVTPICDYDLEKINLDNYSEYSCDNIYEIQFVMPSEHSMEDLPQPNSENVTLKKVNLGRTAVLRFGGWATEERAAKYKDKLRDLLEANGYTPNGTFMVAQYNSPWAIPPFRKNEIIVKIK